MQCQPELFPALTVSWCCCSFGWLWPINIPCEIAFLCLLWFCYRFCSGINFFQLCRDMSPLQILILLMFLTLSYLKPCYMLSFLELTWEQKLRWAMLNSITSSIYARAEGFLVILPILTSPLSSSWVVWGAVVSSQCQIPWLVMSFCMWRQ